MSAEPEARITLLPDPGGGPAGSLGPVRSVQAAELEVPEEFLRRAWTPEYLERLARAYWEHLERISLGLLRVRYERASRTVTLLGRIPLLRFRRPSYEMPPGLAQVRWQIERGILVSPAGRGRGFLRIQIRRLGERGDRPGSELIWVAAEVANYYPGLRFGGRLVRLGTFVYNQTQMRIHVLVTRRFLRSLAALKLPPSRIGALRGVRRR